MTEDGDHLSGSTPFGITAIIFSATPSFARSSACKSEKTITYQWIQRLKNSDSAGLRIRGEEFSRLLEYLNITEEPKPLRGDPTSNKWTIHDELFGLIKSLPTHQSFYQIVPDNLAKAEND